MVTPNAAQAAPIERMHGEPPRTAVADDALVPWTQRRQVALPTVAIAVIACLALVAAAVYVYVAVANLTVRVGPSDPSAGALVQRQIAGDNVLRDFATQMAQVQYGWTPTTVTAVGDRVSPYLSPKIRTEFLQQFTTTASEAVAYDRANFVIVTGTHVFDRSLSEAAVAVHLDIDVGVYSKSQKEFRSSRFEELVVVYRLVQGMSTGENPVGLVIQGVEAVSVAKWKEASREVFW